MANDVIMYDERLAMQVMEMLWDNGWAPVGGSVEAEFVYPMADVGGVKFDDGMQKAVLFKIFRYYPDLGDFELDTVKEEMQILRDIAFSPPSTYSDGIDVDIMYAIYNEVEQEWYVAPYSINSITGTEGLEKLDSFIG